LFPLISTDINAWVNLSPTLRVPKRKDGADGSESSESSSSSDESKKKGKAKADLDISVKGKGEVPRGVDISGKAKLEADASIKGKLEIPGGSAKDTKKQKRLTVQQDRIVKSGVGCNICNTKFSFFKRPHQCKECKNHVCSGCSTGGFVSIVLGWGGKPRRVCTRCLDEVRRKLQKRATMMPELRVQAEKEAKELEYRMSLKVEKKQLQEENSSSSSDSDAENKGLAIAKPKKNLPEYKPQSSSCKVCLNAFSASLKAAQCGSCSDEVCHSCSSLLHSKLLGWIAPKYICEECLPAIKARWVTEKDKHLAFNPTFRISESEEAPFFNLFASSGEAVKGKKSNKQN